MKPKAAEPEKPKDEVRPVSPPPKPGEVVTVEKGRISPEGVATV